MGYEERLRAGAQAQSSGLRAALDRDIACHPYIRATGLLVALSGLIVGGWLIWAPGRELQLPGYLTLHTFLETCSIVVCVLVFVASRAAMGDQRNRNLVLLGAAFLGVALLDFMHAQSYLGMPAMVTPSGAGKAINFWLAARLLAACALLAAAFLSWESLVPVHQVRRWVGTMLVAVASITWVFLYRPHWMPETFVAGQGLTPFKIVAELLIVAISLLAAVGFYRLATRPRAAGATTPSFDPVALLAATLVTAMAELFFTIYTDVNGLFNVLGHVYKVIGAWFFYRGLVATNLFEVETRAMLALESALLGSWSWNAGTDVIEWDATAAANWGLPVGTTPTMSAIDSVVHAQDRAAKQAAMRRALAADGDGSYVADYRIVRPADGSIRHLASRGRTEFRDGKPLRVVGVIRDVTERRQIERAVQLSEARLSGILSIAADAIISIDEQHRITLFNQGAETIFGYAGDEVIGRPLDVLLPERFRAGHAGHVRQFDTSGTMARRMGERREIFGLRKDGTEFPAEASISKVEIDGRRTFTAVLRDVTDRVSRERAMQDSELRVRGFIEQAPVAIAMFDRNMSYLSVSRRWLSAFSPNQPNVIGRSYYDVIPDLPERWKEVHRRGIAGETLTADADPFPRADGGTMWLRWEVRPWHDHAGGIGGIMIFADDETTKVEAEQARRQSEDRLSLALQAGQIGMFEHDYRTSTLYWSPFYRKILGVTADEPARLERFLELVPPEDRAACKRVVDEVQDPHGSGHATLVHRIVRRDGATRWLARNLHTHFESNGSSRRVVRTVGAIRDITEQKQLEEQLEHLVAERTAELREESHRREQVQAALSRVQRMEAFGQLAGGIAHDFNNLLSVISANQELLDMRLRGVKDLTLLRRAQEAAEMGARLTGRLLTFARRRQLESSVLNLNEQISGMVELLRRSIGEHVTLTTNLAPRIWAVRADPSEIENAVLNLAINARDAMPHGGTLVIETADVAVDDDEIGGELKLPAGDYVRISVSDTGTGMTPEVIARAFEPFFTTKPPGKGTGLGLSTIYGFVQQSGGTVTVYSEVGRGTTINIYLPRVAEDRKLARSERPDEVPLAAKGDAVLLVEDRPDVRDVTRARLEQLGYGVVEAENGAAAIELLQSGTVSAQLVLSDVVMPGGVSGFDLARWVRANRPALAVLLTSGFTEQVASVRDPDHAANKLLRKPYTRMELARAVRDAFEVAG